MANQRCSNYILMLLLNVSVRAVSQWIAGCWCAVPGSFVTHLGQLVKASEELVQQLDELLGTAQGGELSEPHDVSEQDAVGRETNSLLVDAIVCISASVCQYILTYQEFLCQYTMLNC